MLASGTKLGSKRALPNSCPSLSLSSILLHWPISVLSFFFLFLSFLSEVNRQRNIRRVLLSWLVVVMTPKINLSGATPPPFFFFLNGFQARLRGRARASSAQHRSRHTLSAAFCPSFLHVPELGRARARSSYSMLSCIESIPRYWDAAFFV